ncbi:MAG: hypothetical protein ACE14V_11360 [bacterium]
MKKVIIIIVVLVIIGAGIYFWVIPNFMQPSYVELSKLPAYPAIPLPETPPATGTNTQTFIENALNSVPGRNVATDGETASKILKSMDYQAAQNLLPLIDQYNQSFNELRQAVNADYNIIPPDFRPERRIPNFLRAQIMGKLLAVKGMGLENQGKLNEAVDAYLLAAQTGSVFAGKNTTLIQKLIGMALEKIAYKPLKQYVLNHPNDTENLKRIITTLEKAEQKRLPIAEAFISEQRSVQYLAENYKQYAKTDKDLAQLRTRDIPRIKFESDKIYGYLISMYDLPYPQYKKEYSDEKIVRILKEVHPLLQIAVPNFLEAHVRNLTSATDNRLIRIMAAIQLYHAEKNTYPTSLSELTPNYLTAVPKDYFNDAEFIYGTRDNSFYLYSLGPDMKDNQEQPVYDPTNGTTSIGDIIGK